jgi:DNA-binding NarL/FixJ family response regulator
MARDPRGRRITHMQTALTEDARRVLDLLAAGLRGRDIRGLLGLSEAALDEHVDALLRHYGAEDRTSLVIAAQQAGDRPGLARLARRVATSARGMR